MGYSNEELAVLIQQGASEYAGELWDQVYWFIYGFVRQYAGRYAKLCQRSGFTADDFMQESYLAMLAAAKHYEPSRGKFLTFLPFYLKTAFQRLTGTRTSRRNPLNDCYSLDMPYQEGGDSGDGEMTLYASLKDAQAQEAYQRVESEICAKQLQEAIEDVFSHMTDRDRMVGRWYLFDDTMTLKRIGEQLGIGVEAARQISLRAMRRLRNDRRIRSMHYGDGYRHKSLTAFQSTHTSVVEDVLERMEAHGIR